MEKYKPKYYVEIRYEKTIRFSEDDIRDYYFSQPVKYCNGICIWDYSRDSYVWNNIHDLYWESKWFNDCLSIVRYNDKIWDNKMAMDKAFEKVFTTKNEDSEGVYVQMKDFEIWLMGKGYEMVSFDKMCSQSPCFNIMCDSKHGNILKNPTGISYSRRYLDKTKSRTISFCFGIENMYLKFQFYFINSDNQYLTYQTPIKSEDFDKAENCQLVSFEELSNKIKNEVFT